MSGKSKSSFNFLNGDRNPFTLSVCVIFIQCSYHFPLNVHVISFKTRISSLPYNIRNFKKNNNKLTNKAHLSFKREKNVSNYIHTTIDFKIYVCPFVFTIFGALNVLGFSSLGFPK